MPYQQNQGQQNPAATTEVAKSPGRISQILATQDLIGLEIGAISGQQQASTVPGQSSQSELEQSQGQMSKILANQVRQ